MRLPHVWTEDEITAEAFERERGGWFYGLVRDAGRLRVGEIIPGLGWCAPFGSLSPRTWWRCLRDLLQKCPRFPGALALGPAEAVRAHQEEERREMRRRFELAATCTHRKAEAHEFGFRWCPDCWTALFPESAA